MLAYVFWHWRRSEIAPEAYERLQHAFHAALGAVPAPGFIASRSAAVSGVPWAAGGGDAYEDWYLLQGSAALDPLNEAAVSRAQQSAHDAAARAADGGTAGLYRLRRGSPVDQARIAIWFAKPGGMSYAALYDALDPLIRAAGAALWGRQMVLGPSPEFCLHTDRQLTLPPPCVPLSVPLRPVWPQPTHRVPGQP